MASVRWRKSSRSTDNGGDCVELAELAGVVGVRDSKHPENGHLSMTRTALAGLVADVKAGKYDL